MAMIEARPDLREDHTQGVLVAEHKIMYEKFDNMQAAGRLLSSLRKRKRITTFIRTGSLPPFDIVIVIVITGPIPTFFSERPEDTLAELKNSLEWAFQCLQALVSTLFVRGKLTR